MKWVYLAIALLACHLSPQVALAAHNRSEVPFKLYRGYAIVVRGSIGNTHNLNLLIDTGAVPSVLDSRIARKLHLQTTRGTLSVFTQQVEVERATIANVQIGLLHANVLSIAVHDLSNAEQVLGIRVDGMIGLDFLGQTAFTIDYGSKKITVGPVDPSLTAVPYQSGPGYIVVEMQIRHRIIPLLVDTGASELVLFQTAEKDWLDANTIVGRRTWSNMSGDVELQKVHLSDVFLGPTHWGSRDALILERANAVPSAAFRGLLGIISLKARRVGFDPDRKVLAWGIPTHCWRRNTPRPTHERVPDVKLRESSASMASHSTLNVASSTGNNPRSHHSPLPFMTMCGFPRRAKELYYSRRSKVDSRGKD
jgi:predicted aspartyl protease